MKCKFYSEYICNHFGNDLCHFAEEMFGDLPQSCNHIDDFGNCACFKPERIEYGSSNVLSATIELPKYSAKISIGDWEINLTNKTFTEKQIKNMKEMLGWEVKNL